MQASCHSWGSFPSPQHTLNILTNQSTITPFPTLIISPYIPSIPADFPFFNFSTATFTSSLLILPPSSNNNSSLFSTTPSPPIPINNSLKCLFHLSPTSLSPCTTSPSSPFTPSTSSSLPLLALFTSFQNILLLSLKLSANFLHHSSPTLLFALFTSLFTSLHLSLYSSQSLPSFVLKYLQKASFFLLIIFPNSSLHHSLPFLLPLPIFFTPHTLLATSTNALFSLHHSSFTPPIPQTSSPFSLIPLVYSPLFSSSSNLSTRTISTTLPLPPTFSQPPFTFIFATTK